jgi:hypothetical protein
MDNIIDALKLPHAGRIRALAWEAATKRVLKKTQIVPLIFDAVDNHLDSVIFPLSSLSEDEMDVLLELLETEGYTLEWTTTPPEGMEEADLYPELRRACTKITITW